MAQYLVGLDGGTTGCKTCIFDLDGKLVGSDYREYPSYYPEPGWVEQTTEDLLPNFYDSIKTAINKSGINPEDIIGFGFSSQGSVIGMLDENGELLRPWVGWQDLRGEGEGIEYLTSRIPRSEIYKQTGDPVGTTFSNAKLAWLKLHEPENWEKTALFSTMQDYFLKQFGADDYYTDYSSASREGMMDIDNECWSKEMHDILGIDLSKRAKIVKEPGKVVGHIGKEVSEKSGLPVGTPICMGAHDQNCCTFGAGAVDDGTAVLVMGTFGSCFVVSDKSIRDPKERLVVKGNHGCGNFTIEAFSNTAASSYRWYRDTFCDYEKLMAKEQGEDPYDLINKQIATSPIGANGITFLSFLQGAGAEKWLYQENEETYKNICKEFHQMYGALSNYKEEWENVGEQLMMFFVYTYFCGAVYDDMVCSKMEMALFSIRWVQEFLIVRWLENGKTLSMKDVEEISWRYAREVEHSDNNLNTLEDWLFENYYLIH